jgi:hypothetical protein
VGAQHQGRGPVLGLQIEGVVHLPRRMLGRNVERAEIVLVILDIGPGGDHETKFAEQGDRPTAYIAGEEGAGAAGVGLRYGRGALHMKDLSASQEVFWQGISIGWDVGGNASRVFTLVYGLYAADAIYRRYPGVEGTAYLIGGLGVNYQRADGIVLAPIRTGVGLRLGANVGTMAYSRQRNLLPF